MTGTTPVEGYPYPLSGDFADVQDAFRLASAIDTDLRSEQAPFRSFMARPSFIGRQLATQSGFLSGSTLIQNTAIDWDNTGGLTLGQSYWQQPIAQGPSWWMFGATIFSFPTSGTPVVGDMNMGYINIGTTDQVTNVQTFSNFYQRNDDTNTNGEWINLFAMAPIYRGLASAGLRLNGSTSKSMALGSRFWGMYLGPVV